MLTPDEVVRAHLAGLLAMDEARSMLGVERRSNEETLKHIQRIAVEALPAKGGAIMWKLALEEIDDLCSALLFQKVA
jgi:hypothetical protein